MRYLGIDYGSKRVGIALSDIGGQMAFPKTVLSADKTLLEKTIQICTEEKIDHIVFGESHNYAGVPNSIMAPLSLFAQKLSERTGLPVSFEPEFLTSAEAGRIQGREAGNDASAAALILGSFLQKKKHREQ